jgi:hypothetical protein
MGLILPSSGGVLAEDSTRDMSAASEKDDDREAWLWQNAEARASLETGVKEARAGLGKAMDFSAFLEDDVEEPE